MVASCAVASLGGTSAHMFRGAAPRSCVPCVCTLTAWSLVRVPWHFGREVADGGHDDNLFATGGDCTVRCSLIARQSLSKRCSPRLPSPGAVCLTACLEQFVDVLKYQASIVKIIMPSSRVTHKYAKQGEGGLRVVRNRARSRGPERCSAVTESPFALSCPRRKPVVSKVKAVNNFTGGSRAT